MSTKLKDNFFVMLVKFNILGLKSLDIGGKNINFASVIRNNILRYGRKSRFKHSPDAGCASIPSSIFALFAPIFIRYCIPIFHQILFFNTKYLRISNKTTTFAH